MTTEYGIALCHRCRRAYGIPLDDQDVSRVPPGWIPDPEGREDEDGRPFLVCDGCIPDALKDLELLRKAEAADAYTEHRRELDELPEIERGPDAEDE